MYDASGIRRSAGRIAERINQLPDDLWSDALGAPLKESLGHSRLEVLVGSVAGPLIALPGLHFLVSHMHWIYHFFRAFS